MATVRSHLKQILVKTGTNRQAETVALIARSVAVLGLRDGEPSPE
jgi:DNA-binding CsgD family transcriptional regulator